MELQASFQGLLNSGTEAQHASHYAHPLVFISQVRDGPKCTIATFEVILFGFLKNIPFLHPFCIIHRFNYFISIDKADHYHKKHTKRIKKTVN